MNTSVDVSTTAFTPRLRTARTGSGNKRIAWHMKKKTQLDTGLTVFPKKGPAQRIKGKLLSRILSIVSNSNHPLLERIEFGWRRKQWVVMDKHVQTEPGKDKPYLTEYPIEQHITRTGFNPDNVTEDSILEILRDLLNWQESYDDDEDMQEYQQQQGPVNKQPAATDTEATGSATGQESRSSQHKVRARQVALGSNTTTPQRKDVM